MGYKPSYAKTVKRTGPRDIALTEYSSSILSMIASGRARSRADLARTLNLAPSTITIKVNELMEAGLISESGSGSATGGRRPTLLELVPDAGFILAADLGAHHLWVGRLNLSGNLLASEIRTIDINDGPEVVLPQAAAMMRALSDPTVDPPLRGVGMSLPGPVNFALGALDSPSRMRGWHEFKVRNWLAEEFGTLAVVDNDANMMALGEHTLRQRESPDSKVRQNTLFLKAGAAIGCGLIIDGQVYRGATGAAGDIAHVQIPAAGDAPCSCGNRGCLETVASGSAIIRDLAAVGIDAADVNDIVRQVNNGDPHTTTRVRTAGRILGQTLSIVVNFVNPDVVVLGGGLSQLEPYVAAVRSQLYESCHPLATKNIVIEAALSGSQAGLLGAGQLCLRTVLAS